MVAGVAQRSHANGRRHALVVGGSMAGLLAARVLADHFDRVTVLERDRFPNQPAFRKGVPQSRHVHILLVRGMRLLEQLFPGLKAELLNAGAATLLWPQDVLWLGPAGWGRRFPGGLEFVSCTRELLEWHVRRRVLAQPAIESREGADAVELVLDRGGEAVAGVSVRSRDRAGATNEQPETIPADLVVDASGRNSRLPRWLESLGYPVPEETTINPFLGYATCLYTRPAVAGDWKFALLQPAAPTTSRGGAILPIEGDRWVVTLYGAGRDYPPTDEAGFLAYARSLRSPVLYQAIQTAERLTPIFGYQRTENRWRHFERLERFPEHLLVVGDAVCAFNPIYGQGMSVAALEADALDTCLREQRRREPTGDLVGLSGRVRQRIAEAVATPWLMATGEDARYPTTEGAQRSLSTKIMHWYLDRMIAASTTNARVNRAFLEVAHLVTPPRSVFRLDVLLPTLRGRDPAEIRQAPPLTRAVEPGCA